ncbi:site-specific integrase [Blastopirellula retiformator]|uniref:Site-specific tyrosine recombinase XerC n=1 Tax=Blastopirellula retiformator TaxID=2527970 RepID=A0A5C5UYX6_9BACT|nr:tyrosine-type recombinase/integrase [Blastopirellula retiformator]TWT30675.1 site-specific tyrosine recombinase XerC [Blastopirellula retiformator]
MSKSKGEKPSKPYPEFPLFAHASGRWCKKINGKFHYFGPWRDHEAALARYLEQVDYLKAGRKPPNPEAKGLRLWGLCNVFCETQDYKLSVGEIVRSTHQDYVETCERIVKFFGRDTIVEHLQAADFQQLREEMAKTLGLRTIGNEINRIRIVLKYAYDEGLIAHPVRFGNQFKRPPKSALRRQKQAKGPQMFTVEQARELIRRATPPMRAMLLLAANCGFGNNDCASLTFQYLDLKGGWHTLPRPKTGIERRCPLWPETVAAIEAYLPRRPNPQHEEDQDLVFITKYGLRYVRDSENAVSKEFAKIRGFAGTKGTFYWMRHTFETIGGESRDQVAVDHIMGHAKETMATEYREWIGPERLESVVSFVREWLYPVPRIVVLP